MTFEKQQKRFFLGRKTKQTSNFFEFSNSSRIPLQQTLDINDIIWYCSEIRHQIEKKRYQSATNQNPLLKYVRSHHKPPTTTTTTTTTATSAYSFSNILTTVREKNEVLFFLWMKIVEFVCRRTRICQHDRRFTMHNNNSKASVSKWSKGLTFDSTEFNSISDWFVFQRNISTCFNTNYRSKFFEYLRWIRSRNVENKSVRCICSLFSH